MNAKFLHPAGRARVASEDHGGQHPRAARPISRACCCPAWPVVQVIMPATASRPHETELLLCAHHYRVSQRALDAAGAVVFVLPGCPDDAMLCDDRVRAPSAPLIVTGGA